MAMVTIADSTQEVRSTVSYTPGIHVDDEVTLCGVRSVTWGFPFSSIANGDVAAIITPLPQPLCTKGTHAISSGTVLTYQPVGGDTLTLRAQPASGWTVTGSVTVTEVTDYDPGEPDLHQRVLSEKATGTFALQANGPDGKLVRFQNGTYEFDIYIRKDPYDPFD
ncbi:MAG TPA: hypothetical protein VFP10_10850 [Candidatus Eisenbacteria bacterium]|nr:hypothetical protein [Candidatus Eisenbacteria bacterium]